MIKITITNDIDEPSLGRKWNNLLDLAANPLPFQRHEWVKCCLGRRLLRGGKLFILLAVSDNELVGIAPFIKRDIFFPAHSRISFIGTGYSDYFDFIIKPGLEEAVIGAFVDEITRRLKNFEIELRNIFSSSLSTKAIAKDMVSAKLCVRRYLQDGVPYLELLSSREDFYAGVKAKLRSDIERQKRRLQKAGELKLIECVELNEALAALEDFFSLHIKRWESNKGYSAYKFEYMRNLMRSVLKSLFPEKIAKMYYLEHNNKKIAVCFAYSMNGRFIYYAPSYDSEYAVYSPGKILVSLLIDKAIESGMREFDFGIGNEAYKLEWSPKNRELYTFHIFSKRNRPEVFIIKMLSAIRAGYAYVILPRLRKIVFLVRLWRFMRRKTGKYRRFE
ncbi:MAG: hypothetical protein COV72_03375 [Candidatus Omnitrophica bacterium CG11_big_fil_rev_8_21_14_0_20_42_13]|uniref:BioF2-like acetyltransferase domain-containing protein n=1 Tax=Candidatus Ghiorseimicrobium undicola TaxID=1974746 RepID=A0A2H0LYE3_9BACT|nr:MAG: hypothetical protein COV72_03375 [Candidatus Omnitrophica bacterium CG11_big_fil_rev_8_21_14_0_20_42_13]